MWITKIRSCLAAGKMPFSWSIDRDDSKKFLLKGISYQILSQGASRHTRNIIGHVMVAGDSRKNILVKSEKRRLLR